MILYCCSTKVLFKSSRTDEFRKFLSNKKESFYIKVYTFIKIF